MKFQLLLWLSLFTWVNLAAQHHHHHSFNRQDSLRGSITPERAWWDLTYYHLDLQVHLPDSSLTGKNTIQYRVLEPDQRLQIDLQEPMAITQVWQEAKPLPFHRDGNAYYIDLPEIAPVGSLQEIVVAYQGQPIKSSNPPWSGGFTWSQDSQEQPFIATTCQGDGASLWWPCKDHMYDEPDSMLLSVRVPQELTDISNGRLRQVEEHQDGSHTFHWFVYNPINNYGVNLNIGDYVHFSEKYQGEKGPLDCNYYVLPNNLKKAKRQFQQVPMMLEAFEHWFGPYPFYEDGYKLVEAPYLGMEHQSSVTYGNQYVNGYLGTDLSASGWGLKFDFIIIHESGHEWFANSITYRDVADMWIHEGFTAYSENLYLDYHYGTKAANAYVIGTRANILNDVPIIGHYDVNHKGSDDMYYKGANMLHCLRQIVADDAKWRNILRGINQTFYHQTVTTQQIEDFLSKEVGRDLSPFFDQYLRSTKIPILEYQLGINLIGYRWNNTVSDFDMPVKVYIDGVEKWLYPSREWQLIPTEAEVKDFRIDPNFYVASFNLIGEKLRDNR